MIIWEGDKSALEEREDEGEVGKAAIKSSIIEETFFRSY